MERRFKAGAERRGSDRLFSYQGRWEATEMVSSSRDSDITTRVLGKETTASVLGVIE